MPTPLASLLALLEWLLKQWSVIQMKKKIYLYTDILICFILVAHKYIKSDAYGHLSEIWLPNIQSQASVVSCCLDHLLTIQHVNKHKISFHNLYTVRLKCQTPTLMPACQEGRHQFVPILWWPLVWPSWGANPHMDTLTTKPSWHSEIRTFFNGIYIKQIYILLCRLLLCVNDVMLDVDRSDIWWGLWRRG